MPEPIYIPPHPTATEKPILESALAPVKYVPWDVWPNPPSPNQPDQAEWETYREFCQVYWASDEELQQAARNANPDETVRALSYCENWPPPPINPCEPDIYPCDSAGSGNEDGHGVELVCNSASDAGGWRAFWYDPCVWPDDNQGIQDKPQWGCGRDIV